MPLDTGSDASDDVLLARYAQGDMAAARELTLRHSPRVFSLALRMLRDAAEAEDVTQEAMLRFWRFAPQWEAGRARASTWLHRVASNLCIDRLRRRRSVGLDAAPEQVDDTPSPQQRLELGERATALRRAMADLPERQREALSLRHFDELSNPEIAEILGTSVEAVESLLSRGRRTLAKVLSSQSNLLGLE